MVQLKLKTRPHSVFHMHQYHVQNRSSQRIARDRYDIVDPGGKSARQVKQVHPRRIGFAERASLTRAILSEYSQSLGDGCAESLQELRQHFGKYASRLSVLIPFEAHHNILHADASPRLKQVDCKMLGVMRSTHHCVPISHHSLDERADQWHRRLLPLEGHGGALK